LDVLKSLDRNIQGYTCSEITIVKNVASKLIQRHTNVAKFNTNLLNEENFSRTFVISGHHNTPMLAHKESAISAWYMVSASDTILGCSSAWCDPN